MFCPTCGNQLPDSADFCPKCGYEFNETLNAVNLNNPTQNTEYNKENNLNIENIQNANDIDEVLLEVRPTFKFTYVVLPQLIKPLIFFIIMLFGCIFMFIQISSFGEFSFSEMMPIIVGALFFPILLIIIVLIRGVIDKKQYRNYIYTFYKDRIVFKDTFMNVSEREIKYKNIREINKRQSFIQRHFNIGHIVLFSNAETGYTSGILLLNIENVDEIYKRIKEIINV